MALSDKPAAEHLLLLPPVPWPPLPAALRAAYEDPIRTVLKSLSLEFRRATQGPVLDIALPVPYLFRHRHEPRAALYHTTQVVVARLYRLICIIAAADNVNVEDAEGIDVRLVLVARPRKEDVSKTANAPSELEDQFGPVVSIPTLARCKRAWSKVFAVESEDGEAVLKQLLTAQDGRVKINKVPGGLVQVNQADEDGVQVSDVPYEIDLQRHHRSVAVGGTWDHVHIGHKLLLTMFAFMLQAASESSSEPRSLTCGVTGDEMLKNKKHAEYLESWHERQLAVAKFLRGIMDFRPTDQAETEIKEVTDEGPNGHAIHIELTRRLVLKLVEIGDPFGPTITDESLTALVFSAETRSGGKAVNDKRSGRDWQPLQLFEVDVLDAGEESVGAPIDASFASKLSSTTIRLKLSNKQRLRSKA